MQGRGMLTGALKSVEDIPDRQRALNPRMADGTFEKVLQLLMLYPLLSTTPVVHLAKNSFEAMNRI